MLFISYPRSRYANILICLYLQESPQLNKLTTLRKSCKINAFDSCPAWCSEVLFITFNLELGCEIVNLIHSSRVWKIVLPTDVVIHCRHVAVALKTCPSPIDVKAGPGLLPGTGIWGSRVKGNRLTALSATDSHKEFT